MEKLVQMDKVQVETGASGFAALLRQEGDAIRRDVFNLVLPQDTEGGVLHAGFTIVYPGCRTKGHVHADREEIYYFVRGKGIMGVEGKEYDISNRIKVLTLDNSGKSTFRKIVYYMRY